MSAEKRAAAPPRRKTASAQRKKTAQSKKPAPKKPARRKPLPRTNSAHHTPPRQQPAPRRKLNAARTEAPRVIRRAAPPRAADPFAKRTGARRSYYTAEFLAEAKRRIETTLKSTNAIAEDLGIHQTVLWRLVRRYGWVRPERSLRLRGLSPAMRLAAEADALVAAAPSTGSSGNPEPRAEEELGPRFRGDERVETPSHDTTVERLEAAVLKELSTVETMRASLGEEPQRPIDAERTARTLSVLTETISKLRRLRMAARPQQEATYDDMPADIDEFRNELTRRIDALVASEPDEKDTEGD
jgi:hypothetical protein